MEEEGFEEEELLEQESKFYIVFPRTTAAMGMLPKNSKWVTDGALTDTWSNVLTSVGLHPPPAV